MWWMTIERDDATKEYFYFASRSISTLGFHIFINGLEDHMILGKIGCVDIPRLGGNGKDMLCARLLRSNAGTKNIRLIICSVEFKC